MTALIAHPTHCDRAGRCLLPRPWLRLLLLFIFFLLFIFLLFASSFSLFFSLDSLSLVNYLSFSFFSFVFFILLPFFCFVLFSVPFLPLLPSPHLLLLNVGSSKVCLWQYPYSPNERKLSFILSQYLSASYKSNLPNPWSHSRTDSLTHVCFLKVLTTLLFAFLFPSFLKLSCGCRRKSYWVPGLFSACNVTITLLGETNVTRPRSEQKLKMSNLTKIGVSRRRLHFVNKQTESWGCC